jgi:hypothetical protein
MVIALVHKCLNVKFSVEIFLCKTCQLEMILYASFQKYHLHIFFFGFSINDKPFTISFVYNIFRPPNFKCTNMKCHKHESSCTSYCNVSCTLFSLFELHTLSTLLYVVNAMSNFTYFSLQTISIVFFFLVGFNVNKNIMLLVI